MMHLANGGMPHLLVLEPDSESGRRIELDGDYMVVGREPACDVHFDDPRVSRTHAALQRHGDAVYVQDLGSSGGTFVNGAAAATARELHAGDVLTFATVTARLETDDPVSEQTQTMVGKPAQVAPARYRIDQQHGEVISNVGRDQYNSYVQHVTQQRENFLREIAATKTKARWLVWTGFVAFVVGFALFAAADLNFLKEISGAFQNGDPAPLSTTPFGREVGGVPIGLLGWALAALGTILLVVGIVLHIVATSRRRRVYREYQVPPPWQGAGPMRRPT
jgi:FHA domain